MIKVELVDGIIYYFAATMAWWVRLIFFSNYDSVLLYLPVCEINTIL